MDNKSVLDKLKELSSPAPSDWRKKAEWRVANRDWLRMSGMFAVSVLTELENQHITKEQLADMVGVSPAYIHNICRGSVNLTLKEICDIGQTLNYNPFEIMCKYYKKGEQKLF
ncbi:MAG: helix-turn-helix transcriptional regulator [Alphaproteobacteria bacterium]|nr:helix-turn-helix transcriptional regulator [Alphaproteobacteria bacterium]